VAEKASTEEIRLILKMISKGYKVPKIISDVVFETAKREIEDKEKSILYKRDPNIHSRRIQGAYVKVIKENTIEIHPLACGGFGADFDGDTSYCFIRVYEFKDDNYIPIRLHISDFNKLFNCELVYEKVNENGKIIKNFIVIDNIYCLAINEFGDIDYKKITHWSIHENLNFFSLNRRKSNSLIGDIKELWISDNHSIVAIDSDTGIVGKINPEELKDNPERYFLIKTNERNKVNMDSREIILLESEIRHRVSEIKFGYFIGALLGDGVISNGNLYLSTSYRDIGHNWSDIADNLFREYCGVPAHREKKWSYDNEYNLRDKDGFEYKKALGWGYRRDLPININQFGNICEDKHLPDWTVNSSDDFVTGLFAGYIDTDGMVRPKELSVESKSKQLLDDFRFVLYYRLGIETSYSEDFKSFRLGTGGRKIPISNPDEYRKYWVLHLPIRKEYTDFLSQVHELLNNPDKKAKLGQYLEACQTKSSTKRVLWVPREILKHPDFNKGKTEGVTSDIRYVIKRSSFTQKDMIIPDHIIDESNISDPFKNLLRKQNNREIEIIPVTCLDIEYDPNITTGYDFTVEDYKTFTTDTGIFLYDTMALYAPISNQAQQQIKDKMITLNNTTKIGASNFKFQNEIYISIFTLTVDINEKSMIKKVKTIEDAKKLDMDQKIEINFKGKTVKTTVGRVIFNEVLPIWYPFVDEAVNKKKLDNICKEIMLKNQFDYAETIDKIMDIGFLYATLYPKSIDLEMLELPQNIMDMRNRLLQTNDVSEQSKIIEDIEGALLNHLKKTKSDLYYIVASGGAKGIGQLRQMMVCKGLIQDPNGNILPPVTKSINEGYSPQEYFDAAAGSRKGTADRAINTGNGGYAYRKMIYVVGNVTADIANADCGSRRTMNIKLTKDLFDRMTGRYVLNNKNDIVPINKSMLGKIIKLRSPIFCKTDNICRICYGDLIHQVNTTNVGMIAAQEVASLSEKIMKSEVGLILYNNKLYTMGDLWNSIEKDIIVEGDLETKVFESEIQGKHGLVRTSIMQKHSPNDKMLFISTKSGHTMICQANHPLWIKKNPMHPKYNNRTCRLSGDEEYKSWGSGNSKIFKLMDDELEEKEASNVKKYDAIWIDNTFPINNENNFEPEIDGYIVGAYCGDGFKLDYEDRWTKGFGICQCDGYIKDRILKESKDFEWFKPYKKNIIYKDPEYRINNIILGRYAWTKRLEPNFINYSKKWLERFLAGYIDTDGTILEGNGSRPGGTCCRIYTCSYHLVQQLKMICLKLGYNMNTTIVPPDKEDGKADKQKRVNFSCDIRFYDNSKYIDSEKLNLYGEVIPMKFKKGELPTKGFDIITTIKEIWKWEYPVYDISTETNEFLLGCVQNHNSFHTGGAVIMEKFDFIKEFMDNLDDLMEPKLRKKIEQSGNDLINKSEIATLRIDKRIYESSQDIKVINNTIPLQVGHFVLSLDDLEVPVAIEQEMTIYVPDEVEQDSNYIVLLYAKGDTILSIKPKQENFSQLARYLDALVGGKYPWGNVQTLYKKFFKALSPVGDWDSTHLEIIISNILRARTNPQKPARLVEPFDPEMYSIKTLPNIISYPLGIAFENFNKGIQYGMITERAPESSIEKVISGEPLTKVRKK
jgi:hypothetical protein